MKVSMSQFSLFNFTINMMLCEHNVSFAEAEFYGPVGAEVFLVQPRISSRLTFLLYALFIQGRSEGGSWGARDPPPL